MIFQIIDLWGHDFFQKWPWGLGSEEWHPQGKIWEKRTQSSGIHNHNPRGNMEKCTFFLGGGWFKMHSIQKVMCFQIFLNLRGGSYITKPSQLSKTQICPALPCYRNTCEAWRSITVRRPRQYENCDKQRIIARCRRWNSPKHRSNGKKWKANGRISACEWQEMCEWFWYDFVWLTFALLKTVPL